MYEYTSQPCENFGWAIPPNPGLLTAIARCIPRTNGAPAATTPLLYYPVVGDNLPPLTTHKSGGKTATQKAPGKISLGFPFPWPPSHCSWHAAFDFSPEIRAKNRRHLRPCRICLATATQTNERTCVPRNWEICDCYHRLLSLFSSVLCGDFVYVMVFPQLLLVLYFEKSNTYGSVFAFFLSLALRLLCKLTPPLPMPFDVSHVDLPHRR